MFLGFGDEKFRAILAESDDDNKATPYISLCASFVHFILVQFMALLSAMIAKSFDFYLYLPDYIYLIIKIGDGIGYLLFIYAITSMIAATMAVFRTCTWYELHQKSMSKISQDTHE